ncbi:FAD synthase [Mycoplasma buteonis]|uniref:FAD synthase n=1 Tax=Mycoplasma buteonis TaxID=171280 RepID=UPI000B0781D0|nr:hypothetical protein [Mycoplasma buteonis]
MANFVNVDTTEEPATLEIVPFHLFKPQESDAFMLGSFESFHKGHLLLYNELNQKAKGRKILVCFSNEDLMPKFKGEVFYDNHAKYMTIAQLDFDLVVQLDFSKVALLEGYEFLTKLTNNLPVDIFVGEDFRFGRNASCDVLSIQSFLPNANLHVYKLLKMDDKKISTSKLKEELLFGNIKFVNSKLISPYSFSAIYLEDSKIQKFEFLTKIHPGVYAVNVLIENMVFYALLHIDLQNNYFLKLFEFDMSKIKTGTNMLIEILDKTRLIVSNQKDKISESDWIVAKEVWQNF